MLVGTYALHVARAGPRRARSTTARDQFSFGSILYEMLTGNRAFDGASGVETLFMVVRDEPPPLSIVAAHVPAPLRWIVDRCLSKDPEDRYVVTRDLARDLQYLRDHFSEAGAADADPREGLAGDAHPQALAGRRGGRARARGRLAASPRGCAVPSRASSPPSATSRTPATTTRRRSRRTAS